ncbi:MAG: helix-turn-helix transcriptional regulator [Saprospiraceae bacterium]|nr:helix-turn-helix transcriptional regulator [Saprospiraceae bacterium]
MKKKKKIYITVEKTDTGYSAFTEDEQVYTTSRNIRELYENLIEALELASDDPEVVITKDQLQLNLDLQQFFKNYKVINANFLAERIGMNPTLLSQYVSGKKRPSARQTEKIIQGIQMIGRELADLEFV